MKYKFLTTALIFALFANGAFAGEVKKASVQKVEMSFEQAYELMLANNNSIKACLEEINEKKYLKKAAVGHFFPKIGINSTYAHLNDQITVNTDPIHTPLGTINVAPVVLQDANLWETSAGAVWNIFTGGKIIAMNSAARARLEGTNQKYRALTNDLLTELVKRYFGLKFAQDVIAVRYQVLETTKKHLEDAKKLEAAGIIAKSERLHAEVAYSQALRDYNSSIRDANIVEEGLKTLIKADNIELDEVEITPSSSLFVYNKDFVKLNEFKEIALKNNPNLKQMEVKKKLAQANYRSQAANYSPVVSLFAYDIVASQNLSYQIPRFAVGATANWMLFDGLTRYNTMRAADCVRKQVAYETIDAKNNINSLVTKQYEELMKYKEQFESTTKSIENANEALRVSTCAFKEGFGTSLSVTDAQTALSGVKIGRLNAIYNYDVTLTELLKTNGNAEEILEYIKNSTKEKL